MSVRPHRRLATGHGGIGFPTRPLLGDYITAVADASHVYAVWTDSRNAAPCGAVDAFRAGTGPKPDVITQCPNTFGNTDIFVGIVS